MLIGARNGRATGSAEQGNIFGSQGRDRVKLAIGSFSHHLSKWRVIPIDDPLKSNELFLARKLRLRPGLQQLWILQFLPD